MRSEIYNFKPVYMFLLIIALYAGTTYLNNNFVFTKDYYIANFSDKMSLERIQEFVSMRHKYEVWGYFISPVLLVFKLYVIAGVIYTGLFLASQPIGYKNCIRIVLIAELITIFSILVRMVCQMIEKANSVENFKYFSPLSLTQLFDSKTLPNYLLYPLQLFNLFEIAYWFVLAYGIMCFTNFKVGKSLRAVASSYGVALLVWVVVVMFIQLELS